MKHTLASVMVCAAGLLVGCQNGSMVQPDEVRLYEGLGKHHRKVTTSSDEAQKYFDQGLLFTFAFNHDEAIKSYTEAAKLDPDMPMAWWGIALCNGPHINNAAMDEAHSKAAWDALQKALALKDKGTPVERALIEALKARYADPAAGKLPLSPEERKPLDKAYAEAMKGVFAQFKSDPDIGNLYAESLMDLRPWDLWSHEGKPRPETPEVIATLEHVLKISTEHPGANHLYIHAVEASPNPEKAVPSAERLGGIAPAAGHLVHMPAHIFARVGRWNDAAKSNRAAIIADANYRKMAPNQGFYHVYMAHNHGFLSFGCMMQGRSEESIKAAREMVAGVPQAFIDSSADVIDGYLPITMEALMRFGKWEEILKEPEPDPRLLVCRAIRHCTRAIAYANLNKIADAEREAGLFRTAAAAVPKERKVGNSPSESVMKVATLVMDGEIAFKKGSIDEAVKMLREAAKVEDTLNYNEPPDWMVPARHALGAILLQAGRAKEAEEVYRQDLKQWPENGWSLYGLAQSLKKQGSSEYDAVKARYAKAWEHADIKIESSCLCVQGE
jgi:tetratricopeptide (TPR) repeat protein